MSAQQDVNRLLVEWDELLREYTVAAGDAAVAEAEHKRLRASAIVKEKHSDPRAAMSLCEVLAEADDTVTQAARHRLVTGATVDAMRGKLAWYRAAADAARSAIATERASAALYAGNSGHA